MTKKILCLFLTLVMIFGALAVLGSCGGDGGSDVCDHVDANKDNKCDECGGRSYQRQEGKASEPCNRVR